MDDARLSQDVVTIREFNAHAAELLKRLQETNKAIVITEDSKPAAVLISHSTFEALRGQLEIVSAIQQGLRDIDLGEVVEHNEARKRVLGRIKETRQERR